MIKKIRKSVTIRHLDALPPSRKRKAIKFLVEQHARRLGHLRMMREHASKRRNRK